MTKKLDGRIALITGASRGIGAAVAKRFAKEGAHLVLTARSTNALEELDDYIRSRGGKRPTLVPFDLNDGDQIDLLGSALHERFKKLDVLVSNAGILGGLRPLGHYSPKMWDETINVNLTSNWRLIRSLDPLLRASNSGRALFVTSGITKANGRPYWGPYAASKSALETLIRTWASELERTKVKVNLIDPGPVATKMRAEAFPGEDQKKINQPDDIVNTFVELSTTENDIHGQRVEISV
ncbi:MAG: oxidoreductase [Rhodospirillaceae bacterium]|nr:oxidoreductase [Alphaproteobacteria bacterium]MBR73111.1 oxidoreductase [Rhodospirillaceae bacterium]|tara:strand:- start:3798 stop:4514 length:717 start_codon:yes stop_codon:yes gene_type:complete